MGIAAALTVAGVVRLATYARRDEIEIMQLVGSPTAYIRGPFIAEGVLQGGIGALVAVVLLWAGYAVGRMRYGQAVSEGFGLDTLVFATPLSLVLIVVGGMAVGCIGGAVAARGTR